MIKFKKHPFKEISADEILNIKIDPELKIGDIVTNPSNGGIQKVINIYEHGIKDVYKLNFNDGRSYECGLEHLWKIKNGIDSE